MSNKNKVEFLDWYGGDEAIACSGWTSTSRDLSPEKRARMGKFIYDLWNAEPVPHGSPFEKGIVHFLVDCDIASHIHLLKHRISSLNAESARYKELKEDKFYLPEDWIGIVVDKKHHNMNYIANQVNANNYQYDWHQALAEYVSLGNRLYHMSLEDLAPILGRKRAKESARFFKTYNSQIQADVMFNMRSFHNFLTQRMDKNAQREIREIAAEMLNLVKNIEGNPFNHTLNAWGL